MSNPVWEARGNLAEILDHWKDGTRPGDDTITRSDVVVAIETLIAAMIARNDSAKDHSR